MRHCLVPGPDSPLAALGAVEGSRLVRLALASRSNRAGMGIIDGAVDPEWRGRGVGGALLAACWASLEQLAPEAVDVEAEDTAESLGFLERRGFVRHEADVYWSLDPSATGERPHLDLEISVVVMAGGRPVALASSRRTGLPGWERT